MRPLPIRMTDERPRRSKATRKGPRVPRASRLGLRVEAHEKNAWAGAAALAGYLSVSDWIRDVANAAAARAPMLSSARQTYNTPRAILDPLVRAFGRVALDPCSNQTSIVDAITEWILERDGDSLHRPWIEAAGSGLVFVNPPYGRALADWSEKIRREAARGVEIVVLVPNRSGARWFEAMRLHGDRVNLRGRIKFLGMRSGATFPASLFYFGERRATFREAFEPFGEYVRSEQLELFSEAAE